MEIQYSMLNASNDFSDLANDIRNYIIKHNAEGEEISKSNLNKIRLYLLSLTAYIRTFWKLQEKVSPEEFINILDIGFTAKALEHIKLQDIVYGFPIKSLVVMIHFQIDSYFWKLCKIQNFHEKGFYKKMEHILKKIDKDKDMQNTLQCLAFFRNSFHSNELHLKYYKKTEQEPNKGEIDRVFECEQLKMEFKHKTIIIYNWKSVYFLIKESVKILMKIIDENSNKEVKK